MYKSMKRNKE